MAWWRALHMVRAGNGVMVVVAVWLGGAHAAGAHTGGRWLLAPLAAFLVAGFGNVLNDILDRDIDQRAHPRRPIPAGHVTPPQAQALAGLLLAGGLGAAAVAGGPALLVFATANAALLVLYEWRLKRLPGIGNLTIGLLVASAFAFGGLAADGRWQSLGWIMAMVALTTLARELLKDIEDEHADAGRRTLPMVLGATATAWVAAAVVGVAVGIDAWLVWSFDGWRPAGRAALAAAGLGFVVSAGLGCRSAGLGQRALKAAMVVALVGLALAL